MGWPDLILEAGIFAGLAGLAPTLRQVVWRQGRRAPPRGRSAHYVEGFGVFVCQTLLFGGIAMRGGS